VLFTKNAAKLVQINLSIASILKLMLATGNRRSIV